ncbi:MAG: polyphenol oxidase family protein [Propionibacteriaceae bacterium]|jgi:YfiH family protein|nr:polyphenol oxidase family protein [Propionibacteriaceae bacterium]
MPQFAWISRPDGPTGFGLAFTNRLGGVSRPPFDSLNLGNSSHDDPAAVELNLERLRRRLGLDHLVGVAQHHGRTVWSPDPVGPLAAVTAAGAKADALVSGRPGVGLLIRVADCLPVLLVDRRRRLVAAAHAGRVGLLGGVLEATVADLRRRGADQVEAWIGPHVCAACYEVPAEMAEAAWRRLPACRASSASGTPAIDLAGGAVAILAGLGCRVQRQDPCTVERDDLFSYRRDGAASGRLGAVVWLAGAGQSA